MKRSVKIGVLKLGDDSAIAFGRERRYKKKAQREGTPRAPTGVVVNVTNVWGARP